MTRGDLVDRLCSRTIDSFQVLARWNDGAPVWFEKARVVACRLLQSSVPLGSLIDRILPLHCRLHRQQQHINSCSIACSTRCITRIVGRLERKLLERVVCLRLHLLQKISRWRLVRCDSTRVRMPSDNYGTQSGRNSGRLFKYPMQDTARSSTTALVVFISDANGKYDQRNGGLPLKMLMAHSSLGSLYLGKNVNRFSCGVQL